MHFLQPHTRNLTVTRMAADAECAVAMNRYRPVSSPRTLSATAVQQPVAHINLHLRSQHSALATAPMARHHAAALQQSSHKARGSTITRRAARRFQVARLDGFKSRGSTVTRRAARRFQGARLDGYKSRGSAGLSAESGGSLLLGGKPLSSDAEL